MYAHICTIRTHICICMRLSFIVSEFKWSINFIGSIELNA